MRHPATLNFVALLCLSIAMTVSVRASQETAPASTPLLPANTSGEEIYRQACAACHSVDGSGQPQTIVGFQLPLPNGHDFPDFNDCATNTVEPTADWIAVVHRGGPVRALDRHMPAFGDALTPEQIERAVKYLWTFCKDASWPRGDLNLPRAFFTEKAFPENETVWTTGVTASGAKAVDNELVYEHRIGSRGQYEVTAPVRGQQQRTRRRVESWHRRRRVCAAPDVLRQPRSRQHLRRRRRRVAADGQGERRPRQRLLDLRAVRDVGADDRHERLPSGACRLRVPIGPGARRERRLPAHGASDTRSRRIRASAAHGRRCWKCSTASPQGSRHEWDVVPQMQVSLSKLQHILLSVGVRVPLNEREERKPQLLTYFLWDWFDGGLFQFWK